MLTPPVIPVKTGILMKIPVFTGMTRQKTSRFREDDELKAYCTQRKYFDLCYSPMNTRGFNLIELMIVMALMAILLTLAYPNYQRYLRSAKRARAEVELLRLSERMQEYYSEHESYLGASLSEFGIDTSESYQFKISELEAQEYLISAAPLGSQKEDNCGNLSINGIGRRGARQKNCW